MLVEMGQLSCWFPQPPVSCNNVEQLFHALFHSFYQNRHVCWGFASCHMEGTDVSASNVKEFPSILLDSAPWRFVLLLRPSAELPPLTNTPWLCIWRVQEVISSPKQPKLKGESEYFTVREQPLDVLSVAPIVYDKSTEGKYPDPDSLCFRRVGLRSVLIRPTAALDSILNPVRLLGSKPRGLEHGESTSGMERHVAELSCCATCEPCKGWLQSPAVICDFFLIECCRPIKFGWIATDKCPERLTLLKSVHIFIRKEGIFAEGSPT